MRSWWGRSGFVFRVGGGGGLRIMHCIIVSVFNDQWSVFRDDNLFFLLGQFRVGGGLPPHQNSKLWQHCSGRPENLRWAYRVTWLFRIGWGGDFMHYTIASVFNDQWSMFRVDNSIFFSANFGWGGLPPPTYHCGVPLAFPIDTGPVD